MKIEDSKIFRYRYDFEEKELSSFIQERYLPFYQQDQIAEVLQTRVSVNGQNATSATILKAGDWIEYCHFRSDETDLVPSIPVLYEDEWIIAISKPDFLPVTPSGNFYFNSIAIWAKEHFNNPDLVPLHRLDIETSGILLLGKRPEDRKPLQEMFEFKKIVKEYQALTYTPPTKSHIAGNIVPDKRSKIYTKQTLIESEAPTSITKVHQVIPWGPFFKLWVQPITGKTNQIRVHLAAEGAPIVGDKKYYPDESVYLDWFAHRKIERVIERLVLPRQALHCHKISFLHPISNRDLIIEDQTPFWDTKIAPLQNFSKSKVEI